MQNNRNTDPLDFAAEVSELINSSHVAEQRRSAELALAPEQDGSQTECEDCGDDIEPVRVAMFRIRCVACQTIKEKRRV